MKEGVGKLRGILCRTEHKVEDGVEMQKAMEISKYVHMRRVFFPPLLFENTAMISVNKMLLDY